MGRYLVICEDDTEQRTRSVKAPENIIYRSCRIVNRVSVYDISRRTFSSMARFDSVLVLYVSVDAFVVVSKAMRHCLRGTVRDLASSRIVACCKGAPLSGSIGSSLCLCCESAANSMPQDFRGCLLVY